MEADRRLSLMVGAFVLLAFGALAVALTSLTSERSLFTPQYTLVAHFDNALGLQAGAPVWLAGKAVGRVESVRFGSGEPGKALNFFSLTSHHRRHSTCMVLPSERVGRFDLCPCQP